MLEAKMPRGSTRRAWLKIYITGWLHGSIRWQLTPEERSVWADLLCLAGECNREGEIADNDGRALPRSFIANRLNIPLELLDVAIKKCEEEGRVIEKSGILVITNWAAYQSEYSRQKKYRKPEDIKDKKTYGEFQNVFLTDNQLEKLKHRFGDELLDKIETLSVGIESKDYKYKNHYAALLSWDRREKGGKAIGKPGKSDAPSQRSSHSFSTQELKDSVGKPIA